jgi:pimeloyl-ACP methyl ester carboxylesterase
MPLPFLLNRAAGLISVALLATGLWFVAEWIDSDVRSQGWLYAGSVLIVLSLFGRVPVMLSLRKAGAPELDEMPEGEIDTVTGAGGSRLHVESFGPREARALVLTHGLGLDRTMWARTIRHLSRRWRVVVWDMPGLGLSSRPFDGAWSMERLAEDLRNVLIAATDRPAVLVGHSAGAMAILTLCRERPEMLGREVAGVALLNATSRPPVLTAMGSGVLAAICRPVIVPLLKLNVWFSPLFHLGAWVSYLNGAAHVIGRATAFGEDPSREAVDRAAHLQARHAPSVQAKGMLAMLRCDAARVPETIPVPTLVVAGGRDLLTLPEAGRAIAEAAPLGEFVLLEPCGHASPLELPEACDHALARHAEAAFARADRTSRPMHADVLRRREAFIGERPSPEPEPESPSFARPDGEDTRAHRH